MGVENSHLFPIPRAFLPETIVLSQDSRANGIDIQVPDVIQGDQGLRDILLSFGIVGKEER